MNYAGIKLRSYAGYLTVDKACNSNLFFWYFPAQRNPENASVILWLEGGPGMSSTLGIFYGNGPYRLSPDQTITENEFSWTVDHHVVYIDNPVGTGYSFTCSDQGYARNETDIGKNLLCALQQFFLLFPEIADNEFYAAGEAYGGKYVTSVGYAIFQDSFRTVPDPMKPKINLKGCAIGNGWIDPVNQYGLNEYLYQLGLVDCNGREIVVTYENEYRDLILRKDFLGAFFMLDKLILGAEAPTVFTNLTAFTNYYNFMLARPMSFTFFENFMQTTQLRKAIHVGTNRFVFSDGSSEVARYLINDIVQSVAPWIEELLSHYRMLFYYGQLDILCAYPMGENFLRNLSFSGSEEYKIANRSIWNNDNDVAGFAKTAANLTEVLVRNASTF